MEKTKKNPKKDEGTYKNLPEPQRLHIKNDEDEMKNIYREKENRGTVEAP
jgi:hypothetical protein